MTRFFSIGKGRFPPANAGRRVEHEDRMSHQGRIQVDNVAEIRFHVTGWAEALLTAAPNGASDGTASHRVGPFTLLVRPAEGRFAGVIDPVTCNLKRNCSNKGNENDYD